VQQRVEFGAIGVFVVKRFLLGRWWCWGKRLRLKTGELE